MCIEKVRIAVLRGESKFRRETSLIRVDSLLPVVLSSDVKALTRTIPDC